MRIKFDSGPSGAGSDFRAPTEIITAQTITELVPALEQLEAAQRGAMVSGPGAMYNDVSAIVDKTCRQKTKSLDLTQSPPTGWP